MNWNDLAREVHQTAAEKGLWDKPRSFDDIICECLVHLGRAYEEHRSGRPNYYHLCQPSGEKEHPCEWDLQKPCPLSTGELACEHRDQKPHGVAVELGEYVLRILDYLETTGFDIDRNISFVHSPDNVPALVSFCTRCLAKARANTTDMGGGNIGVYANILMCIEVTRDWFKQNNIDLEAILHELHECEKMRAGRRGDGRDG